MLSDGAASDMGLKVCVVDERSEIAACHIGVPQNDLGIRTDVLCGCTKPAGIRMLLRAMLLHVIALDERQEEDFCAVEQVYSGCRVLGTIDAGAWTSWQESPDLKEWMKQGVFERYVGISREKDGADVIRYIMPEWSAYAEGRGKYFGCGGKHRDCKCISAGNQGAPCNFV